MTAHLVDSRTMDTRKSYEQTYNTGCNYANMGDLTSAEKDDVFSRQLVTAGCFLPYFTDHNGLFSSQASTSRLDKQTRHISGFSSEALLPRPINILHLKLPSTFTFFSTKRNMALLLKSPPFNIKKIFNVCICDDDKTDIVCQDL